MRTILPALFLTASALLGTTLPAAAQEAGDAARGQKLADTCMGCHGIPGYRNAYPSYAVPKLAGQHPEYLNIALQGYKARTRKHETMYAQAATLSDQDMRDLAAFLAGSAALKTGAAVDGPGKEKAAACVACHGEGGRSQMPNWPVLAGQTADYLEHALHQYKDGERKDPIMGAQVAALSDADIRALASYFAAQPGLQTAVYKKK
ncbi:MAG: c-type cytochrome [Gammaproteobacteria bacterium]|nr:c-type cytochrome [Gammaproteobacteria bacterium]